MEARPSADLHVVVVGASLAGVRCAEALRAEGFVGALTIVGDEPHLPYDRPPLSKQLLSGKRDPAQVALREQDDYASALGATMLLGQRATALDLADRAVVVGGDRSVPFDGLVIATGSRARRLPDTDHLGNVHVVRTLDDSLRLRAALQPGARVVVVGAGFIGAEVASTAHAAGCAVTVLEAAPAPLERQLGAAMGNVCASVHGRHGVELRVGVAVASITTDGVLLADGSLVPADVIVVGVGAAPNTEWLAGSGVAVGDGVRCDEACRVIGPDGTPLQGVVAAGDVARWPNSLFGEDMRIEHWTNAAEMGEHAAATLLAGLGARPGDARAFAPVPYFWSDQYDLKIQFLGRSTGHDEVRVVDGSAEEGRLVALYRRGDRLIGALGLSRIRQVMAYRALLADGASWDRAMSHATAG